jgi:hypothetical protein
VNYLLDTCVISELVKKTPVRKVVEWVGMQDESACFLSVLTMGEIQKGISRTGNAARQRVLQTWLDTDLRQRFSDRILSISEEVAVTWGAMQGTLEASDRPVPTIDGLLAATALTYNLTIVTRNEMDMAPTGARIMNPWK